MKILVTGSAGKLGLYLTRSAEVLGCGRKDFDLAHDFSSYLERVAPDAVIHTAALSAISDCLSQPDLADRVNHLASARLGGWCRDRGVRMVYVSTDMVFDGERAPYDEESEAEPLSEYGRSKLRGEQAVLEQGHLVARVALMVGPALGERQSYYDQLVSHLRAGQSVSLFRDEWRGMLSYEDAALGLLQLVRGQGSGLVHLAGPRLSRLELGQHLASALGCPELVRAGQRSDYPSPEPRPRDLTMVSRRLAELLPGWRARSVEEQMKSWLGEA
ncbi:NAD(P)-dependent oxidoreductase [bacterium]|nr:NAD(P)-dependent oxidoreductase [bacterium]